MHAFAMTLTSDLVSALISGVSAAIAMASALIAYISLREQRQLTVNIASYNQLAAIENMYDRDRSLLELHGIDPNDLAASGITASELIYLTQSFSASELYYRLMKTKRVTLTEFRKNLLEQEKVRVAWTRFINRRFISYGPFSAAVDEHIRSTGATT